MAIVERDELKAQLPREGRLMALDVGSKTVGVATSDVLRSLATPLVTVKRSKLAADLAALAELAARHEAKALVVGLPLNMDGSDGPSAQSARAFARNFAARAPALPILLWDERLSTAAVTRTLIDADASRKRRSEVVDKMAAAYILQGVLERLRRMA
jgi:putative Holliday junction resolvase